MSEKELTAAKDYLERGIAILNKCGCELLEQYSAIKWEQTND